jgi:hypothetical protein
MAAVPPQAVAMSLDAFIDNRSLGRDAGPLALHDARDHRLVCAHMLAQVRRELCLLSRDLDKAIYDQAAFLAGLKNLALLSRFSRIRILLQDPTRTVQRGHRIIELARRLPSSIEIRVPHSDWLDHPESFLLADRYGCVHRTLSTYYEGTADYYAPLWVQRLQSRVEEIWESAQVDTEMQRLYL